MKQVHDKEFAALIEMPAQQRYGVFVRRVADWQEVWGLRTAAGWVLVADENGAELVPVWPHKRFADACADPAKQEYAAAIPLNDWLNKWLPGMNADGRRVAVFPIPSGKGIAVSSEQLKA